MNFAAELKNIYALFEQKKIAIWGLSSRADECFSVLASNGFIDNIQCFIENKPKTDSHFNKPVYSLDYLLSHKDTMIIITERDILNQQNILNSLGIHNKSIFYYTITPYLGVSGTIPDKQLILDIYNTSDKETGIFLDNYFLARDNGWNLFLPVSYAQNIAKYSKKYWDVEDNSLCRYEEITYVDCGAYTGDSLESFYGDYGKSIKRTYLFEPDILKEKDIVNTIQRLNLAQISTVIYKGVSDTDGIQYLENPGTTSGKLVDTGNIEVKTTAIDKNYIEVKGKLCIKMDIEGLEMSALHGEKETIQKYKPELAICTYHKAADILDIPAYVKSLVPEYKCIIRGGVHTVCYLSAERF